MFSPVFPYRLVRIKGWEKNRVKMNGEDSSGGERGQPDEFNSEFAAVTMDIA
jgi:hypothetical protein